MATVEIPRETRVPASRLAAPAEQPHNLRDLQVVDLLAVMRRHWLIMAGCLLLAWCAAAAYFLLVPPTYESQSQLLVMLKDPGLATSGVNSSSRDTQAGVTEELLSTQMQIIQSRRIVAQSLKDGGLYELDSIVSELGDDETVEEFVIDHLDVTRGGEGQSRDAAVLNIAFRHSSAEESKQILDAIITNYQAFLNEKFQDVNKEAAELIVRASTELSDELVAAERAYQEFRENSPILWSGDQATNIHRQRYEELQAELSLISIQSNEAAVRLSVVESVVQEQNENGATDFERLSVIDSKNAERIGIMLTVQQGEADTAEFQSRQPERMENARSEYQALLQLRMKEQRLLQDFGERHPSIQNTRNQIAIAEEFIKNKGSLLGVSGDEPVFEAKDLQAGYVTLLRRDLETLTRRQTELLALAAVEEEKAKTLVKYEIENETRRQQVARQQELYNAVVDRLREINLAKDYGGVINEVIAPAELGEEVWPSLPICLALGTMLGLVLGGGGATVAELRDRSFRSADDIRQSLSLPLLSHIPALDSDHDKQLAAAITTSGSQIDPHLYAVHLPRSQHAEVFRGLRTSVFFKSNELGLKTIAVTSPNMGDGKTTVLMNLAVSMAQAGRSILLVDADMRRPRVQAVFNLPRGEGLSSIVHENWEPWDLVQETEVENLSVLPCGEVPANPAELLSSPKFRQFVQMARERYDHVLIDCPPVLAVADPCIVAPAVDAVILVVRLSKDTRPQAVHAKEMLDETGAALLGTVVNACDANDSGFGSYNHGYRYGYSYHKGYGNTSDNGTRSQESV